MYELNLTGNDISEIKGVLDLKNLVLLTLQQNNISEITGLKGLSKLRSLDLMENKDISTIPNILDDVPKLRELALYGCELQNCAKEMYKFLWKNKNYRLYTNYSPDDVEEFKQEFQRHAIWRGCVTKEFIKWILNKQNN